VENHRELLIDEVMIIESQPVQESIKNIWKYFLLLAYVFKNIRRDNCCL